MDGRGYIIDLISDIMADICGEAKGRDSWKAEADIFMRNLLDKHGGESFTMSLPEDLVGPLNEWQNLRIDKNTDFPLSGGQ